MLGQSKKLELGLMIGNNGQLENLLNDFYNINFINRSIPNSYYTKFSNIKYTASARYLFKGPLSVRIKFGKAIRTGTFIQTEPETYFNCSFYQTVSSISPSIYYASKIGKFELMTGLEIPLMQVANFTEKINVRYMPDSINVLSSNTTKFTTSSGFVWGINNFIGVKYHLTNWLCMGTEMSYGLLFAKLGDKFIGESLDPNTAQFTKYYERDKKIKTTFFSPPEVSFGVFIQLGNKPVKK